MQTVDKELINTTGQMYQKKRVKSVKQDNRRIRCLPSWGPSPRPVPPTLYPCPFSSFKRLDSDVPTLSSAAVPTAPTLGGKPYS